MRDLDVRIALREQLNANHGADPETRIIEELGLCRGEVRIDVSVINGHLLGYEIKSAQDTLERLSAQERVYSRIFDKVTIIAAAQHFAKMMDIVPSWWGITAAVPAMGGAVTLCHIRACRQNPGVDVGAMVQLLWRDEALQILQQRALDRGYASKSRAALWSRLTDAIPPRDLKALVRETLKRRTGWRSASPPVPGGETFQPVSTSPGCQTVLF